MCADIAQGGIDGTAAVVWQDGPAEVGRRGLCADIAEWRYRWHRNGSLQDGPAEVGRHGFVCRYSRVAV